MSFSGIGLPFLTSIAFIEPYISAVELSGNIDLQFCKNARVFMICLAGFCELYAPKYSSPSTILGT